MITMKKLMILLLMATYGFVACNRSEPTAETTTQDSTQTTVESTEEEHHDHDHASEHPELDNGKKWKVNEDMMVHVRTMEKDMTAFASDKEKNHPAMSDKLHANIDLLTSSCTMTGKAHDELHKWLVPFIEAVDEYSEIADPAKADEKFAELQNRMVTFNLYFE